MSEPEPIQAQPAEILPVSAVGLPAYVLKSVGWFGVGSMKGPTGTWGSVAALPFAAVIYHLLGQQTLFFAAFACYFFGVYVCNLYVRHTKDKDPKFAVIDEVAGQWLTLACSLSGGWFSFVVGFFLFRFFDITKLFPANKAEELPEGWGVMTDDMIAGAYAGVTLLIIELLFYKIML